MYKAFLFGFMCLVFFTSRLAFSQDKEQEGIGTQEVLVVKSYTPSLSDAFQIKINPKIPDSLVQSSKSLDFSIKEIPVISTFQPNKATPLKLKKRESSIPYNTLLSGGLGTMNQMLLEVSSVYTIDRQQRFGVHFYRDGFKGKINNALLDGDQSFSRLALQHNLRSRDYNTHTTLQFKNYTHNYFGLYDQEWDPLLISSLDSKSKRNLFELRTDWNWYDFVLRSIAFQVNHTADNFGSSEQQIGLRSEFNFEISKDNLNANLLANGLNTLFKDSYFEKTNEQYTYGILGSEFQWQRTRSDLKLKLGAGFAYVAGSVQGVNSILYYPKVEIVYQKQNATLTPYAQALGGVKPNSYRSSFLENPYVSPTTMLRPTFEQFNAALGVKTSLASVVNFDLGVLYDEVDNFMYFQRLPYDVQNETDSYRLSNAFENQFASVRFYGIKAGLRFDVAKNNFVHFETKYRLFDPLEDQILWNTPGLEMAWEGQLTWKDKIVFTFNGKAFGDRSSAFRPLFVNQQLDNVPLVENKLPLFAQSNFHISYKLINQFDVFIKSKIASKGLNGRWAYYPEPSFLLLGGILYKLDLQY